MGRGEGIGGYICLATPWFELPPLHRGGIEHKKVVEAPLFGQIPSENVDFSLDVGR